MPVEVHQAEIILGPRLTLGRSQAIPVHRFRIALRYALTLVVHDAQIVLRPRFTASGQEFHVGACLIVITAQVGLIGPPIFAGG